MDSRPTPVAIRLHRSTPEHDVYTMHLADHRVAGLAPAVDRRWVAKTRWLHFPLIYHGRLVVGLGVQWKPTGGSLDGVPPVPATLQLAQANAVPETLRRFLVLADPRPRVTFVGSGCGHDCLMLRVHCGLELRALLARMGDASMEEMADRILGYPEISKPRDDSMSEWHAPRLDMYVAVDAFLSFRLCSGGAAAPHRSLDRLPPPSNRPAFLNCPLPNGLRGPLPEKLCPGGAAALHPSLDRPRPPANCGVILNCPLPPGPRGPVLEKLCPGGAAAHHPCLDRPPPPANRAVVLNCPLPPGPRGPLPAKRTLVLDCPLSPGQRGPGQPIARAVRVVNHAAMSRVECSPRAFCGVPVLVPAEEVGSNSKVVDTRASLMTAGDTDAETDYDVVDDAGSHDGLPVRAYASDSEDDADCSPDGFNLVRALAPALDFNLVRDFFPAVCLPSSPSHAGSRMHPLLVLLVVLFVLSAFALPVSSHEGATGIGSCRFEFGGLAVLSCLQPDKRWRPPSSMCCKVLQFVMDKSPFTSNERGACCLCRYIMAKYPGRIEGINLSRSYISCQGKDRHLVSQWQHPLTSCYRVCKGGYSFSGDTRTDTFPGSDDSKLWWTFVAAAGVFSAVLVVWCGYLWCYKRAGKPAFVPARKGLDVTPPRVPGGARQPRRRSSTSPN